MDEPKPEATAFAAAAPASSAGLLLAILESLPFRIAAHDLEGRCVLQNQVSLRNFGSLVGRHPSETSFPREHVERWQSESRRAVAGEVVWGEQQIPLAGELRTYRYVIAPIRSGGSVCGTVSVDIDITDQRRAEQALHETYQKLRQRETELAHLARLSTMGQMASELAHEMSQPLYAINNFAQACSGLVDRPGELNRSELSRWLAQIGQQSRRGGDVLRRIIQFVRLGELHRQRFDLNQAIRDVVEMLKFEIERHGITLQLELDAAPLWTFGDVLLIEQVLVNLIRNAEQAMETNPPGGRLLTLRTFTSVEELSVTVSDTGPGFAPDHASHLFESYFTTKPHGTGLGLAICRSTIEAHRGRIWAANNPTGGATFQFVLPASPPTGDEAP